MGLFEILMLLCFGFAWPFSVYKSYKSRSTKGKSIVFISVVLIGYVAGIINKLQHQIDGVVFFYILNLALVGADCILFWRNRYIERSETVETATAK